MSKAAKGVDPKKPSKTVFECYSPEAHVIVLSGTFNNWDPNALPMERQEGGAWRAELELAPGCYEYKFIADGAWCCEPGRDDTPGMENCVANPFGTMNRIVEVPEAAAGGPHSRGAAQ